VNKILKECLDDILDLCKKMLGRDGRHSWNIHSVALATAVCELWYLYSFEKLMLDCMPKPLITPMGFGGMRIKWRGEERSMVAEFFPNGDIGYSTGLSDCNEEENFHSTEQDKKELEQAVNTPSLPKGTVERIVKKAMNNMRTGNMSRGSYRFTSRGN